ncbi:MAG: hypothetical protein ABJH04_07385 [Cyclobacteriaceae bacterium]
MPRINGAYYNINDIKKKVDMTTLAESLGWVYQKRKGHSNVYVRGTGKGKETIRIQGPEKSPSGFWSFIHEQQGYSGTNTHLVAYSKFNYGIKDRNDDILNNIIEYIVKTANLSSDQKDKKRSESARIPEIINAEEKPLPFEPSYEHPYLEFRGIKSETYNNKVFKGLIGSRYDFPQEVIRKDKKVQLQVEAINYKLDEAMFPNTVASFVNIKGDIINKEFVNRYKDEIFAKKKASSKGKVKSQSIRRFYENGIRANSLFRSNIPESGKASHMFIGEAWMDVMSYFQLHANDPATPFVKNNTLFTAHGGQITMGQIRMMNKLILDHDIQHILLSNDYDKKGFVYNLTLLGMLSKKETPFTFEAKGDKSRAGISVFFQGVDENSYKEITRKLRNADLFAGVEIDARSRAFSFVFTESNYNKVATILYDYRKPELTGISCKRVYPNGFNDWNDKLRGIDNGEGSILEEDVLPLVNYIAKVHGTKVVSQRINLSRLKLEQNISKKATHFVDVLELSKNWPVGRFNLDTLTYEGNTRYTSFHSDAEVKEDIRKITSFFSPPLLSKNELESSLLQGFSLEPGGILKKGEQQIGQIGKNGRLELFDIDFSENEYGALEIIQGNLKSGMPWNTLIQQIGSKLYYNNVDVLIISADSTFKPTANFNLYEEALTPQLEILQQIRPPRHIPSTLEDLQIDIKDGKLWYGHFELGIYDSQSNRFELYPAMSSMVLPDTFYNDLDQIRSAGYDTYKMERNNPNRLTVRVKDSILSFDDNDVGYVNSQGLIVLIQDQLNYKLIQSVQMLGIPQEHLVVSDVEGKHQKFVYTKDIYATQEDGIELSLNPESNALFIGDTHVGFYNAKKEKVSLFAYIPKMEPLEGAITRFRNNGIDPSENGPEIQEGAKNEVMPSISITTSTDFFNGESEVLTIQLHECSSLKDLQHMISTYVDEKGRGVDLDASIENEIMIAGVAGLDIASPNQTLETIWDIYQKQYRPANLENLEMMETNNSTGITLSDVFNDLQYDPKFTGIINYDNGQPVVLAKIPDSGSSQGRYLQLDHVHDLPGYVITNVKPGILESEFRLFQTPKALLDHYVSNRDEIVCNDKISLISPTGDKSTLAILQAAIRCPGTLKIYGEMEFCEGVKVVADKYIKNVVVNPGKVSEHSIISIKEPEVLSGVIEQFSDLNVYQNTIEGKFYFPNMAIESVEGRQVVYNKGIFQNMPGQIWIGSTANLEPSVTGYPRVPVLLVDENPEHVVAKGATDISTGVLVASLMPDESNKLSFGQLLILKDYVDKYKVATILIDPTSKLVGLKEDLEGSLGVSVIVQEEQVIEVEHDQIKNSNKQISL